MINNFEIDKKLLSKELFLNFKEIAVVDIEEDLVFSQDELITIFQEIIDMLATQEFEKYYHLESKKSVLTFLYIAYWQKFKNKLEEFPELLLISTIFISLFLSKVTKNNLILLNIIIENIDELDIYKEDVLKYIDSQDLRGILFWATRKFLNKDYDRMEEGSIAYEYSPPKITPEWLNKYRKDDEPMEFWFYNSTLGKSLFLILYTPKCRYAKCSGCNLPSLSSQKKTTSPSAVYKQVDSLFKDSVSSLEKVAVKEVILSNNGNLFDIKTMPTLSLLYSINAMIEELPKLEKIIIESRIEYLNEHQLKTINEVLSAHEGRNISIEIALGFEIFDDDLRNGYYQKGFYKSSLEKLMPLFSKYNISLKFYMMYKATPSMSLSDAIEDINNASSYANDLVNEYKVNINLHISPTYVAVGTLLEKEFNEGNYTPPGPVEIAALCDSLEIFKSVSYYISLNDEGLSSTHIEDEYTLYLSLKERVDYFNINQEFI